MNQYLQENQDEFNNAIDFFKSEIATIRTGRANPAVLDGVSVKAYGVFSPLNTLSTITVSDSRNIIVTPFDKSTIKDVEKGINIKVISEDDFYNTYTEVEEVI